MPEWNKGQEKAITTTDKGVVVTAAAGSGKTAVLVERTVRMLADCKNKIPADRLLAVTFTVDAASQLRRKLSEALKKKLSLTKDPEEAKWLRYQQDRLPLARISTINSFCLDLVKSNLNEFEFEEGVKIIDENDSELVLSASLDEALNILADKDPEAFSLLYDRSDGSVDKIKRYGKKLFTFLRSLPFPNEWFEETIASMTDKDKLSDWIYTILFELEGLNDKAMKLNEKARAMIERFPERDNKINQNIIKLNDDLSCFMGMKNACESGDWQAVCERADHNFPSFSSTPDKKLDLSPDLFELYKEIGNVRDESKKAFQKIRARIKKLGRDLDSPMKLSAEFFTVLRRYTDIAADLFHGELVKRNSLQFSDVEIMALQLLVSRKDGKTVRTELGQELISDEGKSVILIDEFQDVNDLQELIFKALSDTDDLRLFGTNVFVVGDVKQSIYRFRLSNPRLFINARESASDPSNLDKLKLVELDLNYRSRSNIIDFVNFLFSQLMSEEIGELEYTGGERLKCGAEYKGKDAPVEVIFVDRDTETEAVDLDEESEEEDNDDAPASPDENNAIAKRIRELIDSCEPVTDPETKELRPCRAGDFCVLYRGGKSVDTLASALGKYGLKVASEKSEGYLRSREISLIYSLLRIIDDPMRDIPMAAVMLSPIMGFNADELARIRMLTSKLTGGRGHLYQVIAAVSQSVEDDYERRSDKIDIEDTSLRDKCSAAKELISKLGFYSAGMSISRLIRRIYDETEIVSAASAYENSKQKRANLRLLLEYAESYQDNSDGSVAGFIRYLESILESKNDLVQAVTTVEDENSVVVKTIHSSKGLEFPFVFLCGLSKKFRLDDTTDPMLLDEYSGAGFTYTDLKTLRTVETASHAALSVIGRDKVLSEEIRLLYVALTRAKERLFIPIDMKRKPGGASVTKNKVSKLALLISESGGVSPRIIRECGSYLEWICAALLCAEGNEKFLESFEINCPLPKSPEKADIVYISYDAAHTDHGEQVDFYSGTPDEDAAEQLLTGFIRKETHKDIAAIAKMTVTEIVAAEKEKLFGAVSDFYPGIPSLDGELKKLTATQKGTYTHLFMELADYENAEKNVRDELQRLVESGLFTKREASGVYIDAVSKFFAGELYQRMKRSGTVLREKKFLVDCSELALDDRYRDYISEGSVLQGVADCLFEEGDGYILVDYKTDNFEDISELTKYRTQLELYKYALDLILDKPVKACYIYSFRLDSGALVNM